MKRNNKKNNKTTKSESFIKNNSRNKIGIFLPTPTQFQKMNKQDRRQYSTAITNFSSNDTARRARGFNQLIKLSTTPRSSKIFNTAKAIKRRQKAQAVSSNLSTLIDAGASFRHGKNYLANSSLNRHEDYETALKYKTLLRKQTHYKVPTRKSKKSDHRPTEKKYHLVKANNKPKKHLQIVQAPSAKANTKGAPTHFIGLSVKQSKEVEKLNFFNDLNKKELTQEPNSLIERNTRYEAYLSEDNYYIVVDHTRSSKSKDSKTGSAIVNELLDKHVSRDFNITYDRLGVNDEKQALLDFGKASFTSENYGQDFFYGGNKQKVFVENNIKSGLNKRAYKARTKQFFKDLKNERANKF